MCLSYSKCPIISAGPLYTSHVLPTVLSPDRGRRLNSSSSPDRAKLKQMDTHSGEATLTFSFLPPFSIRVNSYMKEFAPREQIVSFKSRLQFESDTCTSSQDAIMVS